MDDPDSAATDPEAPGKDPPPLLASAAGGVVLELEAVGLEPPLPQAARVTPRAEAATATAREDSRLVRRVLILRSVLL